MKGNQRLSLEALHRWEALGYGMFIHFGMSTYDGEELSHGDRRSTDYAPADLDVDQWIRVARDAGMKYAVLTAKHVSGHCLWPTAYTDYHVGTSGNPTDVVGEFTDACRRHGLMSGLYYCSWDNHHLFGSLTPSMTRWADAFTTEEYRRFQTNQIVELLATYGPIGEVWVDIPTVLPRDYRHALYDQIADVSPEAVIMMNHGIGDGTAFQVAKAWPTDLISIERFLPNSHTAHEPWREIEGSRYYLPGEVCDPIGREWFHVEDDKPRDDRELLGIYLVTRSRGANLLLDVPPDRRGLIPDRSVEALMRLKENLTRLEMEG